MDVNLNDREHRTLQSLTSGKNPESLPDSPSRISPGSALELAFQEYAPNTRRAYSRAFRELQEWAGFRNMKDFEDFDPTRLLAYKQKLRDEGKKPSTINQHISAIRRVCRILHEIGFLKDNPFDTSLVRAERVAPISHKGALTLAQLHAMMEANERVKHDSRRADLLKVRNGLVLKFLYLTAARRSEAAGLRWEDIQHDGAFKVVILRKTKSGEAQKIKLRDELHQELVDWKSMLARSGVMSDWVFLSLGFRTLGRRMTGKGINDIITRLGAAIGLRISAHYLRHTAITLALELGEPLQKVQSYARHASANTTIRYFHDQQLLEKNPTDRLPLI